MFPDSPEALPLPPNPGVEQFGQLAKELVEACASPEAEAVGVWVDRWLDSLARALAQPLGASRRLHWDRLADGIEAFAVGTLKRGERRCALADAQLVLARSHGFDGWPRFAAHLDGLAQPGSPTADFEAAVEAIVAGDEATLRRLLAKRPELIRARSAREHGATLLHYVAANGVENWRQKTPPNAVAIAELLLAAGAEVEAEANLYGGGSTTLGLAATSAHPRIAGVQLPLLALLLDRGARIEHPNLAGNDHGAVQACLANGCPEAARYLADRGARLELETAAGVGRLDVVRALVETSRESGTPVTAARLGSALRQACLTGQTEVAAFLLSSGANPAHSGRDGQTALHCAAIGGHLGVIELLLEHDPPLEVLNEYGGTVLGQTLWSAGHAGDPDENVAIIEALLAAGAQVGERHPPINARVDALLARHGCTSDPDRYWFGEQPRRRKAPPP